MVRVTTNGTLINYKSSLNRTNNNLNTARDKVLTKRNFLSYAEDPAAATRAFKLRRSFSRTSDQITNNSALTKKFETACTVLESVTEDCVDEAINAVRKALNDTSGSGRQTLGATIKDSADAIVQSMNAQYGSAFVFAGNDALGTAPFSTTTGDDGVTRLVYRGIEVSSDDPADQAKLDAMNQEKAYADLGSGLSEVDGKLIESSVFNGALSGISFLGYGLDDEGDPKNAVDLMYQLADIFSRCDADSGEYGNDTDKQDAEELMDKLGIAQSSLTEKWTELDGKAAYLQTNEKRLTSTATSLNEQILEIEQVNMADAITDFSWAQYCYNAALKVGNSLLSQSLIDYMN